MFYAGFTLVELLVVVIIVLILAALLSPALARGLERALAAKCTNNLRQVGMAARLYASENDGKWLVMGGPLGNTWWDSYLISGGYLSSNAAFCPAYIPKKYIPRRTYGVTYYGWASPPDDPASNPNLCSRIYTNGWTITINLNAISKPSRYILAADSYTTRYSPGGQWAFVGDAADQNYIHLRHDKRAHILFADGHVAAHNAVDLATFGWNTNGVITDH